MAHKVLISLGSNSRQSAHIQWASQRLSIILFNPSFSRVMWTSDSKGTGRMYMNRLVSGSTEMTLEKIEEKLKAIEHETGRTSDMVTIDLDLMSYDERRYHLKDWSRPYIQQLINSE